VLTAARPKGVGCEKKYFCLKRRIFVFKGRNIMAKKSKRIVKKQGKATAALSGVSVSVYEDDPDSGTRTVRPAPDITARGRLAYTFPSAPAPAGIFQPDTPEFRYWNAAEALRRGADFWATWIPDGNWEVGPSLRVLLDEGTDLNAFYDRQALNFFHGPGDGKTVFSGASPDILCHEMGHAILDTIKPQLWGAASHEAAAFHEAFGDMSAILAALQLPSLRSAILTETHGHLYRNSRLSRLAEQLGAAIRLQAPDAVDPDCLRNAVNSFTYRDPITLPQMAPASHLSSEPHSFSRVFTGAFFEIISGMLSAKAKSSGPTPDDLLEVTNEIGGILVSAVKASPVVANWYSQVAAAMVQKSADVNAKYAPIMKGVFVRRSILSLGSASDVQELQSKAPKVVGMATMFERPLGTIAIPSYHYGLDDPLMVESASHPRSFAAMSGNTTGIGSLEPRSSSTAAVAFVDDLFCRGRVDYAGIGRKNAQLDNGSRVRSHRLAKDGGAVRLHRCLFDCGLTHQYR
jgi:hypothetical protein